VTDADTTNNHIDDDDEYSEVTDLYNAGAAHQERLLGTHVHPAVHSQRDVVRESTRDEEVYMACEACLHQSRTTYTNHKALLTTALQLRYNYDTVIIITNEYD